jgi:hypothetical protein
MAGLGWSQNNFLPTHHFSKDQLFSNQLQAPYNGGGFFPVTEREYALIPAIIDSSSQYSPKQTHDAIRLSVSCRSLNSDLSLA